MNKAFVKETDDAGASNVLPDRPIPSGPNYVTAKGLAQIEEMIALTEEKHTAARAANDSNEVARAERDIRYWTAQRATAQLVDASPSCGKVEFGSTVTIRKADDREQTFRIVGIDEADPNEGTLSHISPLAKALLGRRMGEEITFGPTRAEITKIR